MVTCSSKYPHYNMGWKEFNAEISHSPLKFTYWKEIQVEKFLKTVFSVHFIGKLKFPICLTLYSETLIIIYSHVFPVTLFLKDIVVCWICSQAFIFTTFTTIHYMYYHFNEKFLLWSSIFARSFIHHKPKRAGNSQNFRSPKKITQAKTFVFAKAWAVWKF